MFIVDACEKYGEAFCKLDGTTRYPQYNERGTLSYTSGYYYIDITGISPSTDYYVLSCMGSGNFGAGEAGFDNCDNTVATSFFTNPNGSFQGLVPLPVGSNACDYKVITIGRADVGTVLATRKSDDFRDLC